MSTHPEQFSRQHRLSEAAAEALHKFKAELNAWPAYLESLSTSVVVELLTWFWREVHREGTTEVNPLKFRPRTKVGRKAGSNQYKNLRRLEPELPPD